MLVWSTQRQLIRRRRYQPPQKNQTHTKTTIVSEIYGIPLARVILHTTQVKLIGNEIGCGFQITISKVLSSFDPITIRSSQFQEPKLEGKLVSLPV